MNVTEALCIVRNGVGFVSSSVHAEVSCVLAAEVDRLKDEMSQEALGHLTAQHAAGKRNEQLREAIAFLQQYACDTHRYWDQDEDHKVGKRLAAMAGWSPGYEPELTKKMKAAGI